MGDIETVEVLIVDDRPENLLTLETVLASPEYVLIRAKSGDEALRYLLDHEPALILMDVQMPGLDGFETASIIKKSERTRYIPIIFMTALNQDERYALKGYSHGAIDYIYKPYDPQILKSKVATLADLARKTKKLIQNEKQLRETEKKDRERQIAQLELRSLRREQSEQKKYLELVEGISHGIVWSAETELLNVTFVSPSAESILGYVPEQWTRERGFLVNHIHPDDQVAFLRAIEEVQIHRRYVKIEHRFISKEGSHVWLQTELKVSTNEENAVTEIRALSIDITQIKFAQEVLNQNKKRSDFLAESSLILGQSLNIRENLVQASELIVPKLADWFAVFIKKENGEFEPLAVRASENNVLNPTVEDIEKLGLNVLLETGREQILSDATQLKMSKKFKGIQSAVLTPIQHLGKTGGAIVWVSLKEKAFFSQDDLYMFLDFSRRVSVAMDNAHFHEKADAAIRVRDEFLSVASHELKTPLTPLKLQAQLLVRVLKSSTIAGINADKVDKILSTFERQLDRLSTLIDELLDISKIANGKLSLNVEKFDMIDLVRDVLNRFSGLLVSSKCEVIFDATGPIFVELDRFRMEQIFVNLLTNACKYGQGKPIQIDVRRLGNDRVEVAVKDHGIGIAQANLSRIFDRFERAVSSRHFAGLGLGLYIVTQLLEAHQGKIRVKSSLGEGSTFAFDVPVSLDLAQVHDPEAVNYVNVKELEHKNESI